MSYTGAVKAQDAAHVNRKKKWKDVKMYRTYLGIKLQIYWHTWERNTLSLYNHFSEVYYINFF